MSPYRLYLVICHMREGSRPAGNGPIIIPGRGPSRSSAAFAAASACSHMQTHQHTRIKTDRATQSNTLNPPPPITHALCLPFSLPLFPRVALTRSHSGKHTWAKKAARSRSLRPCEPRISILFPVNVCVSCRGVGCHNLHEYNRVYIGNSDSLHTVRGKNDQATTSGVLIIAANVYTKRRELPCACWGGV
jgi:hypothetical protein